MRVQLIKIYKDLQQSDHSFLYPRYLRGYKKFDRWCLPNKIPGPYWLANTTHCTKVSTEGIFPRSGYPKTPPPMAYPRYALSKPRSTGDKNKNRTDTIVWKI